MLSQEKLRRLNELARKAKAGQLTEDELAERELLRTEYLETFRSEFRGHLDRIQIVDEDGEGANDRAH